MARGLAARTSGDLFVDKENQKWELDNIWTFPEQEKECFESVNDLENNISQFKQTNSISSIEEINTNNKSTKAAVVFTVRNVKKKDEKTYLRYFKKFNKSGLPFSWGGKQLRDSTGLSISTGAAASEHICIKPSDIIETDRCVTPEETIELINEKIDLPSDFRHGTVKMLHGLTKNSFEFVEGLSKYRSIVEKYVGEYAAPIYLMQNQEWLQKNISLFPKNVEFKKIFFPVSGNWPLTDSFIYDEKEKVDIGVSSKGGSSNGASASIKTISEIYRNDIDFNHQIRYTAKEIIDTIHIITDNSMIDGPIYAAINMNLITKDEGELVTHYVEKHVNKPDSIVPKNILTIMETIKPNLSHENYSIGLHMLSGIARNVCNKLNQHENTNEVFRVALESKNFVQVYAYTEKRGDAIRFSKFSVIHPSKFDGRIIFSAQKPYMATTKPKGKITFKLEK